MRTIEMVVTSVDGRTDVQTWNERGPHWIEVTVSAESAHGESVTFIASANEFSVGDSIAVHVGSGLAEKLRRCAVSQQGDDPATRRALVPERLLHEAIDALETP